MAMTGEQVETASNMLREGATYAQIGATLGLTRNVVIGKMRRLKLSHLTRNTPRRAATRPRKPSPPPRPQQSPTARLCEIAPCEPALPPPAPAPPGPRAPVTLSELLPDSCRFGHGDPRAPEFRFCGAPATRGPYCGVHAQICYEPAREKR